MGVGHTHGTACIQRSEDSLRQLTLSFHPVGLEDGSQAVGLSGRCLYLLRQSGSVTFS